VKFLKASSLINFFFIFVLIYLIYHTVYGKFNIGNYLIYQFEEKMYKKLQSNLDQKMLDINIDLHSFYSNKEDYIDEITKQNNPNIQDGETILKLD
jgi:cell division protein FtsB|tara:strand:+ start:26 stop:313 length:288 start_codon:yes stop_codon:yes gene_type:complete